MTTIMIVDDSAFLRRILRGFLCKERFTSIFLDGCRLIEASDKAEAWQQFKQERPDLALLDIVMETSERDGIELLDDIVRAGSSCKVIMMTAIGQERTVRECLDKGASDYVLKPFDEEQVFTAVQGVLQSQHQAGTANATTGS